MTQTYVADSHWPGGSNSRGPRQAVVSTPVARLTERSHSPGSHSRGPRQAASSSLVARLAEFSRAVDELKMRLHAPAVLEAQEPQAQEPQAQEPQAQEPQAQEPQAQEISTPEIEIGRLFVRAEDFVNQAVAEAQQQASRILADARATAERQSMKTSAAEIEIGRLFVRAEDFVNHAVAESQQRASQILADARATADRIVAEARQQAVEVAAPKAMPLQALQQFERTIDSFKRANGYLTRELAQLHSNLASQHTGNGQTGHSSIVEPAPYTPASTSVASGSP
jgi:vacuolar-type H+-ATPase subunit H